MLLAISPKASRPNLVIRRTSLFSRAAATAWFEALPPGPSLKAIPRIVSPHLGIRSVRQVRSATKAPKTQTFGFAMVVLFGYLFNTTPFLIRIQPYGRSSPVARIAYAFFALS